MAEDSPGPGPSPAADQRRALDAFEEGNRLAAAAELEQAERAYRQADELGHPAAATYVGLFAQSRGELEDAFDAYRRADERGDGAGALRLGLLHAQRGEWDKAQAAFARADERPREEPAFDTELLLTPAQPPEEPLPAAPRSAFANPVIVGAVTVLIALVAVFLAYNANRGLPFVPTRELKVDVTNGADLVVGNFVVEGGFRVGLVSSMKPVELGGGQVGAQLTLKLDKSHGRVPVDSSATIRPRSVLGTKLVELIVGSSRQAIPDGGTLPLAQTSVPVQIDDVFKTFDAKTRTAIQRDLAGFGDTLAARGSALNDTISNLPELLIHLRPVARYLAAPDTELTRFLQTLNTFVGTVAPVAQANARLFTDLATTLEAISRDPNALESTIAQSPPTLDVSTDSLRVQQPFLVDFTALGRALTPATSALDRALPQINPALEAGARTLPRTPALNAELQQVLEAVRDLATASGTNIAVNALTTTVASLNPMLRYLGPYVTACDYWNYWWTYLSEHISEQTTFGMAQRVLIAFANHQPNNVGSVESPQPANGYGPLPDLPDAEYLHNPTYGAAIDSSGFADCETGQRGYPQKLNFFDPKGRKLDMDQHTPGDQGPTYHGRQRVPAGESFTRNPQVGPTPPPNPANP